MWQRFPNLLHLPSPTSVRDYRIHDVELNELHEDLEGGFIMQVMMGSAGSRVWIDHECLALQKEDGGASTYRNLLCCWENEMSRESAKLGSKKESSGVLFLLLKLGEASKSSSCTFSTFLLH